MASKPITCSTHRLYPISMLSELLPEPVHLHIDRSFRGGIVLALHGVDDLAASEHPTGVAGQETEEAVLGFRQPNRDPVDQHFPIVRMNH